MTRTDSNIRRDIPLVTSSFDDLLLAEPIQRALAEENYVQPTPIQANSIPHLLAGRDLLGSAQTGTGKTAAFVLPILQRLHDHRRRAAPRKPRVLVLSPTRELAVQIANSFEKYGRHVPMRIATVYGGVGQGPQVRAMLRGVHVLIATPGRLQDLMEQGFIQLDQVEVFVLDEADRMCDMGFFPVIQELTKFLPEKKQSLFFSATMPPKIAELASDLLIDPVRVSVSPPSSTVELIDQKVYFVSQSDKPELLFDIIERDSMECCLVFTKTKHGADRLVERLRDRNIQAEAIHGNKTQNARQRTLQKFRQGHLRILVATDLAARGIDVAGISHVINFDLPHEPESYVHRIGRTGRAGSSGIALSFCDHAERKHLIAIERLTRVSITVDQDHAWHVAANRQGEQRARRNNGSSRRFGKQSSKFKSARAANPPSRFSKNKKSSKRPRRAYV